MYIINYTPYEFLWNRLVRLLLFVLYNLYIPIIQNLPIYTIVVSKIGIIYYQLQNCHNYKLGFVNI